ncbi:MAG: outer membrane beta-barrel domain-containing protein [Bdellovibrionaceae bacterium]|nr:outer membrane beta-barrel domain-containing protein [Pseudobdellovibrionaceae bacterium]
MYMKKLSIILISWLLVSVSWAQDTENEDLDIIELELEKARPKPRPKNTAAPVQMENRENNFSDLANLVPFSEVSVLQKRFLPKTGRGQIFGGLSLTTNDPFYNTVGATIKGSYFFSEMWGLELQYYNLSSSEAKATKELYDVQNIGTDSLSYTKEYLGVNLLWVPIYGKLTWFNRKIVPFDFYFGVGGGQTRTHLKSGIGTFQLTSGQIFAISKSFAIRWDFSWNFFSAKAMNEEGSINNLFFSAGASFFFPEAKYR